MVSYELQQGNFQAPLYLIPILREIFGDTKDEVELRIIALEVITALQVASLRPQAFQFYSGIDLFNKTQRDKFIETLVNSIVKK